MANLFSNLFGSIVRGLGYEPKAEIDFIPKDAQGNVVYINGGEASWMSLDTKQMQLWAYKYCSPLSAIIDRQASADTNGILEALTVDGKDDYSVSRKAKALIRLLNNPNSFQTGEEWRGQQVVYKRIFGYCPVYCFWGVGMEKIDASYLYNLNPLYCEPVYDDTFTFANGRNPIKEWKITIFGRDYVIPSEKIFILKDGYVDQLREDSFLPMSKVTGCDYAISNICAAMEADNVLLKKKGPLGIFSHDPRADAAGVLPMSPDEKTEIQSELQNYGLSHDKWQFVVSRQPMKWNAMSYSVRDLMTKETARQGIDMLCDRFDYPAELMSGKNATYENRSSAEKFLYNNNIIPCSLRDIKHYNNFFETEKNDFKLGKDFSHLPVLQEDTVKEGEGLKAKTEALDLQFKSGIITKNQYLIALGFDSIKDGDTYYEPPVNETKPTNTPA